MPSVATDLKTNLKSVPNFFFCSEQFLLLDTIGNKIAVAIFFEISLMATKKFLKLKKCNKATTTTAITICSNYDFSNHINDSNTSDNYGKDDDDNNSKNTTTTTATITTTTTTKTSQNFATILTSIAFKYS